MGIRQPKNLKLTKTSGSFINAVVRILLVNSSRISFTGYMSAETLVVMFKNGFTIYEFQIVIDVGKAILEGLVGTAGVSVDSLFILAHKLDILFTLLFIGDSTENVKESHGVTH